MTTNFLVPVAPAIQEFYDHLLCHPRTILSARYGDGKSYFLDAFIKDKEVRKKFKFITIYPVNYQVLENQDIFDVIKYDILLQMGLNDMMDETLDISSLDAFMFCLKTNGLDLVESMFNVAGSIEGAPKVKAIGKIGVAATKLIKKIKDAVGDYKKYKAGDTGIIDKFLTDIDKNSAYEEDPITKIIQNGFNTWRKKKGNGRKKLVLLFEDMDRIDPAHLFRILNIFSAHMDFSYRYQQKPDETLMGNKFGVDNVVMVIHYENLESIFHHFYGKDTCFEGYIHKFADKGKFVYSLKAEATKYFYPCLEKLTGISTEALKQALPEECVRTKTMRELFNSLDKIDSQCKVIGDKPDGMVVLMACMRRINMDDNEIVSSIHQAVYSDFKTWLAYLYPCLKHFNKLIGGCVYLYDNDRKRYGFYFHNQNGEITVGTTSISTTGSFLNVHEFLNQVLTLVSK